jgi:hypothetical protein
MHKDDAEKETTNVTDNSEIKRGGVTRRGFISQSALAGGLPQCRTFVN